MALTKPDRDIIDIAAGMKAGAELTITTGAITLAENAHAVDTESDDPTDDLDTINAGVIQDGSLVMLYAADDTHTVVLKHNTGNIVMADGMDYALDDAHKSILLRRDGANFRDIVPRIIPGGLVFIENQTLSAATQVDLMTLDWAKYAYFTIKFVLTVSASTDIWMRFSQAGSFVSTGTPYSYVVDGDGAGFSNAANQMNVADSVFKGSANYNEGVSGIIDIFPPVGIATAYKPASFVAHCTHNVSGTGNYDQSVSSGQINNIATIDGIRLLPASGNFPDGFIELWGVRKSA